MLSTWSFEEVIFFDFLADSSTIAKNENIGAMEFPVVFELVYFARDPASIDISGFSTWYNFQNILALIIAIRNMSSLFRFMRIKML